MTHDGADVIPREILDRQRVLLQAERTEAEIDQMLATGQTTFRSPDGLEASADDLRAVQRALRTDVAKERRKSEEHEVAYLPRSRVLSNLQSLAANRLTLNAPLQSERYAVAVAGNGAGEEEPTTSILDHPALARADDLNPDIRNDREPITGLSVANQLDDALMPVETLAGIVPYSSDDPRWLTIGLAVAYKKTNDALGETSPFNPVAAPAELLGPKSRLYLFGDWGSGIERAQKIAKQIEGRLRATGTQRECHVIHLGDTYFAGWPWEQALHVLKPWPAKADVKATSWALPGNHDYYSGAEGFFDVLLRDPRFRHQGSPDGRPTSMFELSNDTWMILGLDSSVQDHDLPPVEVDWLRDCLARAGSRKVVLLSHHQPWSVFTAGPNPPPWQRLQALYERVRSFITGKGGALLWSRVKPLIGNVDVEAWYWGHEHRLALYKPMNGVNRPRLLGNAGVPTQITDSTWISNAKELLLDYESPLAGNAGPQWCKFAFAVVDLNPDGSLTESYYDEDGGVIQVPNP